MHALRRLTLPLALLYLAAPALAAPPRGKAMEKKARAIVSWFNQSEFEKIRATFDKEMAVE